MSVPMSEMLAATETRAWQAEKERDALAERVKAMREAMAYDMAPLLAERDALAERVKRLETLLDDLVKQAMAHGLEVTATLRADDEAAGR